MAATSPGPTAGRWRPARPADRNIRLASPAALNIAEGDYAGGATLTIKVPTGGATIYLAPGEAFYLDVDPRERVYAVAVAGTQAINVLARGV